MNQDHGSPDVAPDQSGTPQMPSSQPVLLRSVRWALVATLVLAAAFAAVGWWAAGTPGAIGGALGVAIGGALLLLTAASIALANRAIESPAYLAIFFGTVMGGWLLKFVAFLVAIFLLKDQPWLDALLLLFGMIAGVLLSVIIDVVIVAKARIPLAVSGV